MNKFPSKISIDRLDNMVNNYQNGPFKENSQILSNNPINSQKNNSNFNLNNSQSHLKNLSYNYNEIEILKSQKESNLKFINNVNFIENLNQRQNEFLNNEKNKIINKINNNNNNSKNQINSNEIELNKKKRNL